MRRKRKTGKYNFKKVKFNDITFDSELEFRRYIFLRGYERRGAIFDLQVHLVFYMGDKRYTSDFTYQTQDKFVVEDVKSSRTAQDKRFKEVQERFSANFNMDIKVVTEETLMYLTR